MASDSPQPPPTSDQVRAVCRRICDSPRFRRTALARLLGYIVEKTLAEQAADLTETVIGKTLFAHYRVNAGDSIVRVEASNLRKALHEYYETLGVEESVQIGVPPGGYVAFFSWNGAAEKRRAIREFFGGTTTAAPDLSRGVIVVQSDPVDRLCRELIEQSGTKLEGQLTITSSSRFFKARTVVNHWDVDGAQAIRDAFLTCGLKAPNIMLTERGHAHRGHASLIDSAPFMISMGLYSDQTEAAMKNCAEWLGKRSILTGFGDALLLHEGVIATMAAKTSSLASSEDDHPPADGFRALVPPKWNVDTWRDMQNDRPGTSDYAMILRHTKEEENHSQRVLFVVAGFTEYSTAVAGTYLGKHWPALWETHFRDAPAVGLGDFLVVIEGCLNQPLENWSEALTVTPEKLANAPFKCQWERRISTARE